MSSTTQWLWRGMYAILALSFTWFVTLQFNDVDAWLWVVGYGVATMFCLTVTLRIYHTVIPYLIGFYALIVAAWLTMLVPMLRGQWWQGEVEREFGGLCIVLVSQLAAIVVHRQMSRS